MNKNNTKDKTWVDEPEYPLPQGFPNLMREKSMD